MPLSPQAPPWARDIVLAYESGAHGQFILFGNVHDHLPVGDQRVNLNRFIQEELLSGFDVIFDYDIGSGLRITRGAEQIADWLAENKVNRMPREPLAAVDLISHYLRFLYNLRAMNRGGSLSVACILRGADQFLSHQQSGVTETEALASLVKDWAEEYPFCNLPFASFLIASNLNDLHPLVSSNPRVHSIRIPLPDHAALLQTLEQLRSAYGPAFSNGESSLVPIAAALVGVTVSSVESMVKMRAFEKRALVQKDWVTIKKQLVEKEASGLVEFIESTRTLADYHGQETLKHWLQQDMMLWQNQDVMALPMGYLICGPVGTGKTFLVECLAGEAGVPVVKLKNFRDRWVGSSEGNLEQIFRLIHALGRCMVFVDEADQALGQRQSGQSDSGLSGRIYAMIAQEMADTRNRGRVIWILASSRPDLIEVDLKRPGRVDMKVPLLPTTSAEESADLIEALCRRYRLELSVTDLMRMKLALPILLTPSAAEALAIKVYRQVKTAGISVIDAMKFCLTGYQPPVPPDVMAHQMRIAIREASDLSFVPESLRYLLETP
ncbi:MAG: AAA family ATPase [Desulfatirhabdiaceae bacterium]